VVATLLFFLIMALSGNSCPFIYTFNGEEYVFAGEVYSGAVYPALERDDYLHLPELVDDEGTYRLKIANQLEEEQHTNLLELMVFDHQADNEILVDKYGNPHMLEKPSNPLSAKNLEGTDVLPLLADQDDLIYVGNDPSKDPPRLDGVILTFTKPVNTPSAEVVIEAKNSYWLDFVYQNFRELLGFSYDKWVEKQQERDVDEMVDWSLSQNIPLSLYLWKNDEWIFQDYYHTVGPMAFKMDILQLDLSGVDGDQVTIKLESGSYFWEIGYVGLDPVTQKEIPFTTIQISEAIDELGESVKHNLINDDDKYYFQQNIGNEATVTFHAPEQSSEARSLILHSKGHYHILQDPKGVPKIKALKEIRKSGNFNDYSNELMQAMLDKHVRKNGKGRE
jgi:hypothetical protein